MSNAYTELEATVYYFDAKPQALPGALSRFAQFFVAPLCKAGALEREVKAIESEFAGVRQSDSCRLAQLRCQTARELEEEEEEEEGAMTNGKQHHQQQQKKKKRKHPFSRFFWGNRASLFDGPRSRGTDIRAEVVTFQESHYCAERMSLVVLGGHSLDELEAMARAEFGAVKSAAAASVSAASVSAAPPGKMKKIQNPLRPTFEAAGPPFSGGFLHVLPAVKAGHVLHVAFCLPPLLGKRYRAKAEEYCSHLVGHEGAGSLLSLLKRKGWASALCAGVGEGGTDRSSAAFVFEVAVTLTEAGLRGEEKGGGGGGGGGAAAAGADKKAAAAADDAAAAANEENAANNNNPLSSGKACGLAVAGAIFRYLALLRGAGPQRWVQDEVAAVSAARFKFSGEEEEASEYVARLAATLHHQPPAHALSAPYLHDDWDPRLVSSVLGELRPEKARIDLRSSSFAAASKGEGGEKDTGEGEAAAAVGGEEKSSRSPLERWASGIPGARIEHEPWFDFDFGVAPLPRELVSRWEAESDAVEARARKRRGDAAAAAEEEEEARGNGGASAAAAAAAAAAAVSGDGDEEEGLALPPRNCYIATDFSLRCDDEGGGEGGGGGGAGEEEQRAAATEERAAAASAASASAAAAPPITPLCRPPSLLLDEPGLRLWHKLDASFRVPKASLHAHFTPAVPFSEFGDGGGSGSLNGALGPAAAHLCSRLLDDALCEEAYLADVAGLSVDAWPEGGAGIEVRVEGFSHRLPELSRAAFAALGRLSSGDGDGDGGGGGGKGKGRQWFDFASAFGRAREALAREYRNSHVKPERHATHLRLACLKRLWAPLEVARALEDEELMTPEGLAALAPALLAGMPASGGDGDDRGAGGPSPPRGNHLELLVQGNVSASEAMTLARAARAALPPFSEWEQKNPNSSLLLPASRRPEERVALLPRGSSHLLRAPTLNPHEPNSVVEVYFQLGPDTPRARAVLDLVAHAAAEPCYNRLRTREQLGYSVHAGARSTHGVLGYCVVVVSSGGGEQGEHSPEYVDGRIDAWMAEFGRRLEKGGGAEKGEGERESNGGGDAATTTPTTKTTTPDAKKHRKSSSSSAPPTTPSAADLAADAPPIGDAELAQHVAALRALKSQADRSLSDEAERHWERCGLGGGGRSYDFLCREEELAELAQVTRADAVALWRDWLAPGGRERRRLAVHVCGGAFRERALVLESSSGSGGSGSAAAAPPPPPPSLSSSSAAASAENVVVVADAEAFRSSLPQAPSRAAVGVARAQAWGLASAAAATAMETQ